MGVPVFVKASLVHFFLNYVYLFCGNVYWDTGLFWAAKGVLD